MHLLIIDNYRDFGESLADLLRLSLAGLQEIVIVADRGAALEVLVRTARPVDAVILHLGLPWRTGIDTAGALKEAFGASVPALVALGETTVAADMEAAREAFDHVLATPDVDRLLALLLELRNGAGNGFTGARRR